MREDRAIVIAGRVTVTSTPGLQVEVSQDVRPPTVADGRGRIQVVASLSVSGGEAGGLLRLEAPASARRSLTMVVEVFGALRLLEHDESTGGWSVHVEPGQWLRILVVEHPAGTDAGEVLGALDEQVRGRRGSVTRSIPPEPTLSAGADGDSALETAPMEEMTRSAPPEAMAPPVEAPPEAMAPPAESPPPSAAVLAEPPALEFAEVGASMPAAVRVEDPVDVVVRLSRGEVRVGRGRSHDEQVIVVDPAQPVDVTLLRRGLELADAETGHRELRLPAPGEPDAELTFCLRAVTEGEAEVQVVVRQAAAQPLATLRLTTRVLPAGARLDEAGGAGAVSGADRVEAASAVAPGVSPFLAPKTLTIDENLVGSRSELTFELVLHGVRRSFPAVLVDKTALLAAVFAALDDAWETCRRITDSRERHAAFHQRLRSLGAMLAREALPPDLLLFLRHHLDDVDELTIITSGETDIPWELVHVAAPEAGDDPDGRGFLGRAGLVRWVYNTPHPQELRVRRGAARHLIPTYRDSSLLLTNTAREIEYLRPFHATGVRPADGEGLARLLRDGQVDLLHFAGHGRSDDSCTPPVREMLLAGARRVEDASTRRLARAKVAFGLDELRQALESRPQPPGDEPGPLVVLNACRLGQAPSTRSEVGGFAETFLRGGAGAFVGCLWSVGDEPARAFVEAFYAEIVRGSTMARATVTAREAARAGGDLSWLAYTVYAHPDATVTTTQQRGTLMTSSPSSPRKVDLSPERLVALHPYVIDVPDGRLAEGPSTPPTSVHDFRTTKADVDAIFETYLPSFLAGRELPVPLVVWAHGGLVGKESGLGVAQLQVEWWKANGAFPVHFVWETGLADSLWNVVKDSLPGRSRGLIEEAKDKAVEVVVRKVPASIPTWGDMKAKAALASEPRHGGAWYFAQRLGEYVAANPGKITVHAVGHSAGSIFHSHLVPEMLAAGVPTVASLDLLAPAITVPDFKDRLMRKAVLDRIEHLAMFTMSEAVEKRDTCIGIYGKSLLYLIRASLEQDPSAEILGLQECVRRDADLKALFKTPESGAQGEVMWSQTVGDAPFSSTKSTSHGGFDNDRPTMNSLARRILGREKLRLDFPVPPKTRGLERGAAGTAGEELWPTEEDAYAYIEARQAEPVAAGGRRRALCIGIDSYPAPYKLAGCVADAKAWQAALGQAGFTVELLTNKRATRERMVEKIKDLVVSSRTGDVLALQYSGHGTTVEDFDHDEEPEFEGDTALVDEAICPVDFTSGNLLIDDDLGELWDLLPDGVSLTVFFDSCHSGGSQRALTLDVPTAPDAKARIVVLSSRAAAAYRRKRGSSRTRPSRGDNAERSVFFAACQPHEVAWESNGQGDFTRRAIPLLGPAIGETSNQTFYDSVVAAFGDAPKQTPVLRPRHLAKRPLLAALARDRVPDVVPSQTTEVMQPANSGVTPSWSIPNQRDHATATILRGLAELLET